MSMQDPIADMLTRIRNGQLAKHQKVSMQHSKLKEAIASVLKSEGYIRDYSVSSADKHKMISIALKYYQGNPVIDSIKRVSRPGLRVYKSAKQLLPVPGFGVAIVSTSKGVMSHNQAKLDNLGGEVMCEVA